MAEHPTGEAVPTGGAVPTGEAVLVARAEAMAARLLNEANSRRGRGERRQGQRISRLLEDPEGLAFILALTDEVLRIRDRRRAAGHLRSLVSGFGSARFLGPVDRRLLLAGSAMAELAPFLVVPLVKARVRSELAGFVIPAESGPLGRHIARRHSEGASMNINLLGEAVLGDDEANNRLKAVIALLDRPDVDYVSVKFSSVCAQLNMVGFECEVERVAGRLRLLYEAAMRHRPHKFVNLDMEEYRDLDLTVAVFQRVLNEERYAGLDAGIVLQAYLPDSLGVMTKLTAWARERHRRAGATTRVRIVKGANLAMEGVEAELMGWPQAPFTTKAEVDANYKRMLDVALDPANSGALFLGIAGHNLFEIAWALTLSEHLHLKDMVEVEMLEGMAPSMAAAVRREAGALRLYAPIARRADNESVIAYLVRRFDENTGPDNFLRKQFSLRTGSGDWTAERDRFRASVAARHDVVVATRRTQDRRTDSPLPEGHPHAFFNVSDTDFSLATNRAWIGSCLGTLADHGIDVVPAVVGGRTVGPHDGSEGSFAPDRLAAGRDPSDPGRVAYRWVPATASLVDEAVHAARPAGDRWRRSSGVERRRTLIGVGASLARARGRLIGVMARDAGKTVAEADPEVSEAVDFAHYYAQSIDQIENLAVGGARFSALGTVVVAPPWNFPLAIPAGGVLAALAAGNAVILKPAPETVATAWALVEACWAGGVPRDLLQFLPCEDDEAGRHLITHPDIDAVILTGAWSTARMFLGWRPSLRLHAETSGKNAVVVTAAADLDAAVVDIVHSAFGHGGQKCSAASLAILEACVYDDARFLRQLADAVRTLRPGPSSDLRTTLGPLIRTPQGPLLDALTSLGPGEAWLVEPRPINGNPQLWSPGVKLGVLPGSVFHLTECFGPVLGLMRAADLDEAITWQNQPAYGLTAGIQSLDPAEIEVWRARVEAGNLYVNRPITGAIVRRQPFGGWKRSVVGPGAKAGGPNYVSGLGTWQASFSGDADQFAAAVAAVRDGELAPVDPSGLAAEANVFRYLPLRHVLLRVGTDVDGKDVRLALTCAEVLGVGVTLSSTTDRLGIGPQVVEDDQTLAARLSGGEAWTRTDKVRFLGEPSDGLRLAAHDAGLWVDDLDVVYHPRLEALRWLREQALSDTRHRHGDITGRHRGILDVGAGPR